MRAGHFARAKVKFYPLYYTTNFFACQEGQIKQKSSYFIYYAAGAHMQILTGCKFYTRANFQINQILRSCKISCEARSWKAGAGKICKKLQNMLQKLSNFTRRSKKLELSNFKIRANKLRSNFEIFLKF